MVINAQYDKIIQLNIDVISFYITGTILLTIYGNDVSIFFGYLWIINVSNSAGNVLSIVFNCRNKPDASCRNSYFLSSSEFPFLFLCKTSGHKTIVSFDEQPPVVYASLIHSQFATSNIPFKFRGWL